MSQAEALLASLDETEIVSEHEHPVTDSDSYFVIDPITRSIANRASKKNTLMQYDHDSERFTFEVARYVEGHDMMLCNRVRVHYINIDTQTGDSHPDLVELDDLQISPENPDAVICSWLISRQATQLAGALNFLVQYMCVSDVGTVDYEWHSDIYEDIEIKASINNGEAAIIDYTDLVEQWRTKLFGSGNSVVAEITLNAETQLKNIENEGAEQMTAVKAEGEAQVEAVTKTGDEKLDAIESTSDAALSAIVSKGEETLATIPEDYTTTYNMASEALRTRANAIVETAEGETIVANDCSDDYLRGFKMYGKTSQVTTSGKNLFEIVATSTTSHDVTFTINDDGSVIANGTASGDIYFEVGTFDLSGEYILSGCPAGGTDSTYFIDMVNFGVASIASEYGSSATLTNDGTSLNIRIRIMSGTTVNNLTFYPMVRPSSIEDATYEPYTGGSASPSPEWPQELESVGSDDTVNVRIFGSNLFNVRDYHNENDIGEVDDDDFITIVYDNTEGDTLKYKNHWTKPIVGLRPDTDYTLILEIKEISGCSVFSVSNNDNERSKCQFINSIGTETVGVHKYTVRTSIYESTLTYGLRSFIRVPIGSVGKAVFRLKLQEVANTDTTYEPYKGYQTLALNRTLPGIPVSSGGNYTDPNGQQWICDEVDFERGVYVQRVRIIMFNGSDDEVWNIDDSVSGINRYVITLDNPYRLLSGRTSCICSHGVYSTGTDIGDCFVGAEGAFYYYRNDYPDHSDWIAWLKANPIYVLYRLETPIETSLTDEELFSFSQLHSNYPNTTILNDSGVKMEVTYNADTKTYFDNSRGASDEQVTASVDEWLTNYFSSAEEVSF